VAGIGVFPHLERLFEMIIRLLGLLLGMINSGGFEVVFRGQWFKHEKKIEKASGFVVIFQEMSNPDGTQKYPHPVVELVRGDQVTRSNSFSPKQLVMRWNKSYSCYRQL
jgi:hypothetical protein